MAIARLSGVKGEVPAKRRNREGEDWYYFKNDVASNGISDSMEALEVPILPLCLISGVDCGEWQRF